MATKAKDKDKQEIIKGTPYSNLSPDMIRLNYITVFGTVNPEGISLNEMINALTNQYYIRQISDAQESLIEVVSDE